MVVTILTPTYNRANCLKELFDSLNGQTCKDFKWLIVDDGSTDNTKEVVQAFQNESCFPIGYQYKTNGGKHTALNIGISKIDTELTFIVDSDDKLKKEAIEVVIRYHNQYKEKKELILCGYSFLRVFPDGRINGKAFKKNEWIASLIESRINSGDADSDKAEVYYTNILKQYPFPEYPGEKFLGEDVVWVKIAKKYKMVHINKGIYIGDYLREGLTQNRRMHNIKSPVGCMNRAKEYLYPGVKFSCRAKCMMQYIIYGLFSKCTVSYLFSGIDYKLLFCLMFMPSLLIYLKWKRQYLT